MCSYYIILFYPTVSVAVAGNLKYWCHGKDCAYRYILRKRVLLIVRIETIDHCRDKSSCIIITGVICIFRRKYKRMGFSLVF